MLVTTVRKGEVVNIGNDISIRVKSIKRKGTRVTLELHVPRAMLVLRGELLKEKQ
jgi:sRNA-binding carbon storage regulator CsrA